MKNLPPAARPTIGWGHRSLFVKRFLAFQKLLKRSKKDRLVLIWRIE